MAHLVLATAAAAQVRDTIPRRDTLPEPDTTAAAQDTTPPPVLVPFPDARQAGWADGAWTWDHAALAHESAVSVLDLVARIPGVLPLRSGVALQPEAASLFGAGGTRTIVDIDGFVLDPLLDETLDLSTIELASLASVRIERRADVLRIRLRTTEPGDAQPQSRIEAGLGEPNANFFRGVLLVPHFVIGPLGLAIDRSEFEGAGIRQPATASAVWLKWGHLRETWGVQAEWRSHGIDREAGSPRPASLERRDFVVRARKRLAEGFIAEITAGRSTGRVEPIDAAVPDSLRDATERTVSQTFARAVWVRDAARIEATVRYRDGDRLPGLEAALEGSASMPGRVDLEAGIHQARWSGGADATGLRLFAAMTPIAGVRLFGEATRGARGGPAYRDTLTDAVRIHDRTAYRAGAESTLFGVSAGAAFLRIETDSVTTYALPPDSAAPVVAGGEVTGWEGYGRVPLRSWLAATGAYTSWLSGSRWAYLPASMWRAALEINTVPLPSGNLEIHAAGEAVFRGAMQGPPAARQAQGVDLAARTVLNARLSIRILDVHIFVRFDDMMGSDVEDVPGQPVRGPRVFYGVKWDFRN